MDVLSGLLAAITSFVSSVFALVAAMHAIEALPLGKAYFADTPLRGLTWGELGAWLLLFYGGALGIGLLHGYLWRGRYAAAVAGAAALPPALMGFAFLAASMGTAIIGLPLLLAHPLLVLRAVRWGARARR